MQRRCCRCPNIAGPLLCADNLWSVSQYPGHVLTYNEQQAGHEFWRVADSRRSISDSWIPVTANSDQWGQVQCDRMRGATFFGLDRGHNLGGLTVNLQISNTGVAPFQTVLSIVVPPTSEPNALSDTSYGVTTEELACLCLFPLVAALYWRLDIPAMGAGLLPQVVGLWTGLAYQPAYGGLLTPWDEDQDDLSYAGVRTEWGWLGHGPVASIRRGEANLRLATDDEYDQARLWRAKVTRGAPSWICYDTAQGDRSFLAIRPQGHQGIGYKPRVFPRQGVIQYEEHEALRTA